MTLDKVPIDGMGDYSKKMLDKVMRAVVLQADSLTKEASPVDTGRFAVSWMIGRDDTSGAPAPEGKYSNTTPPPKGSNYKPGTEEIGNVYYIHNNLPYAEPVTYGTALPPSWGGKYRSKGNQVDPNWFEMVAKEMTELAPTFAKSIFKRPL